MKWRMVGRTGKDEMVYGLGSEARYVIEDDSVHVRELVPVLDIEVTPKGHRTPVPSTPCDTPSSPS